MHGIRIVMSNAHHNQLYYYDFELPTLRRQFFLEQFESNIIRKKRKLQGTFIVKNIFNIKFNN